MCYTTFMTDFCEVILVGDEKGITNLELKTGEGKRRFEIDEEWVPMDDFFTDVKKQVLEYFVGKRKRFDVTLNPFGTDFQRNVWFELAKIPFGETRSYKDIAVKLGKPNASRAVGMVNSKNPIPLIIPCHRVIGANGKLTGFAHGLSFKEKLLNHEAENNRFSLR